MNNNELKEVIEKCVTDVRDHYGLSGKISGDMSEKIIQQFFLQDSQLASIPHRKRSRLKLKTIFVDRGIWKSKSKKIKNLRINFKTLLATPSVSAVGWLAASTTPPSFVIIGTIILSTIFSLNGYSISLDEKETIVAYVLHCLKYKQDPSLSGDLSNKNVFRCYNSIAQKNGFSEITEGELQYVLERLKRIKCITFLGDEWDILEIVEISI